MNTNLAEFTARVKQTSLNVTGDVTKDSGRHVANFTTISSSDHTLRYYAKPYLIDARHQKHCTIHMLPPTFVALDFETADYGRDSACALARVGVEASADVATAVPLSAATASITATARHLSTYR